jgi:glycosyltransferase involved in cell wall biosynthesis
MVNITGGGLSGGYQKYLKSVVPLLRQDPRVDRLDVFVPRPVVANGGLGFGEVRIFEVGDGRRGFPGLRAELRDLAPDVVFIPTARWLNCDGIPVVVMVQNMEALACPVGRNSMPVVLKNLARSFAARRGSRRAQGVIAVSSYVKEFLVERIGIQADKVFVVQLGVNRAIPSADARRPPVCERFRGGDFAFTVGSVRPYRGLEDIIDAMVAVARSKEHLTVVVAGRSDPDTASYERGLRQRAEAKGVANSLVWAGQLGESELSWCYDHCSAFLMTSRVEACPSTLLEAMSHGCVCVSTTSRPMPEFLGEGALYYPPGDGSSLARQLVRLSKMERRKLDFLRGSAFARAQDFTWEKTVDDTLGVLERVAYQGGGV